MKAVTNYKIKCSKHAEGSCTRALPLVS